MNKIITLSRLIGGGSKKPSITKDWKEVQLFTRTSSPREQDYLSLPKGGGRYLVSAPIGGAIYGN